MARVTAALDATGPWEPISMPAEAAGVVASLAARPPLDAAVLVVTRDIINDEDPDGLGRLLGRLREAAPRPAPILLVAGAAVHPSLDVLAAIDGLFTGQSVTDQGLARAAEQAAFTLRLALAGLVAPEVHATRLPLLWPRTIAASAKWAALAAELVSTARIVSPDLLSVGLLGGSPHAAPTIAGVTIAITVQTPAPNAAELVATLGARVWGQRAVAAGRALSLAQAVALAKAEHAQPLVLVDAGDRIDQGGAGDGVDLLAAVAWHGVAAVLSTGHVDPDLVGMAMRAGVGASRTVVFRGPPGGGPFETDAEVLCIGATAPAGTSVVLRFGAVTAVVSDRVTAALQADLVALAVRTEDYTTVLAKAGPESGLSLRRFEVADWHDVDVPGPTSSQPHPDWAGRDDAPYPVSPDRQWLP